jgi:MFS family permease
MKQHSLINTLLSLRGNPRGCVYTEPLWGIPFNLYSPYISIYMIAIGLSEKEIGLIASIGAVVQVFFAIFSGTITDKLGRRLTTLIFDIVAWSIPALISAIAQNFWYFLGAAIINGVWRITHTSWSCLLVEDAEPDQLVDIYSWIYIANLIVGFVSPLAGFLINAFTLVPTVRGLYIFAAVMFTVKAVATYLMTEETAQGKIRMHETRDQHLGSILVEQFGILGEILRTPQTLYTAAIMLIFSIYSLISGSFWGVIVTKKMLFPDDSLAFFQFIRAMVMIVFFFVVMPRLSKLHFKLPMAGGFLLFVVSQWLLIMVPEKNYWLLGLSVFLEACSFATVSPLIDRITVVTIDAKERARILSILSVGIILLTSPFGWIAGNLSTINKDLPFVLNIGLFILGALLAYLAGRSSQKDQLSLEQAA